MSFVLLGHLVKAQENISELSADAQLAYAERIKTSDSVRFSEIIEQLKARFEQLSINQKYYFLYLSGYKHAFDGNMSEAIRLFKHVEQNSNNINLRYRASTSLVNLFALRKDWQGAFEYLDLINRSYESVVDVSIRHRGLIAASIFYNELEQFELTKIYADRLISEEVSGRDLCFVLSVKLYANLSTEISDSLEEELLNAINTCESMDEQLVVNVIRSYLGKYYNKTNQHEKTIDVLQKHHAEAMSFNYPFLKFEFNTILATAYEESQDFELSSKYAQQVLDFEFSKDYIKTIVAANKIISDYHRRNKNYEQSLEFHDKYVEAQEAMFEQTKAKQIAIEFSKHRAIEKDNQIKILNNQNRILQLENELSEESAIYNRWIIILLGVSVSILMMWVFYVKRSQQKLRYLAEFDSLTGVSNRAYFNQNAETILNYYSKTGRTASLLLFDLDNFKKINDTYGHPIGDEVLKLTAEACKACVRKVDIFGRVGGEEFAMLLPGCELEQAKKIAEDCRAKIEAIDTSQLEMDGNITASFGIADSESTGYLLKDLTSNADEAMYLAKRRGRNRVVSYQAGDSAA